MAVKIKARYKASLGRLEENIKKGTKAGLGGLGSFIRTVSQSSIAKRNDKKKASQPGKPPYTHTGALRKSIKYAATDKSVVTGPTKSSIGMVAATHEHGGIERKTRKPRKHNFKFFIGGIGPIRNASEKITYESMIALMEQMRKGDSCEKAGSPIKVAKLTSPDMVRRATDIFDAVIDARSATTEKRYPARPFMEPALTQAMTYREFCKAFSDLTSK